MEIRNVVDEFAVDFIGSFWLVVKELSTKGSTMGGGRSRLNLLELGRKVRKFDFSINQFLLEFQKLGFESGQVGTRIGF